MLTLREDYVASLDPYAPLLADRLRARFYMERMGLEAALEAIRRPAELGGRPFAPGVAEQLAEDLRQVRVPGQESTVPGQYVEPVQLQVVCYQLWENIKGRVPGPITAADLREAGDVDQRADRNSMRRRWLPRWPIRRRADHVSANCGPGSTRS